MANSIAFTAVANDHDLIRQVAAGNERAFDELYQGYSLPIFNYILRLVHEPSVAEELLQEVFLAVWQGAGRFREQATVKTWLLHIAHNQSVSWLRRNRKVSALDDLIEVAADDQIEEQVARAWHVDQVYLTLDRLSPKHRAVVELAFVHQLSYTEIAQVLSCPIGTVKSRMSYALRHLASLLKEIETEGQDEKVWRNDV